VEEFRHQLIQHRLWALGFIVVALLMKLAVPAGFMPVVSGTSITIELCSGNGPEKMVMTLPGAVDQHGDEHRSGKADMPCGYAGHAPSAMSLADPILIALAISYIVATVFRRQVAVTPAGRDFLRPHLRGPPATA
jgi:hypothetical protein